MPFIPPGYAQANHKLILGGDPEPMMVTLGIEFDAITFVALEQIANEMGQIFENCWKPHINNFYAFAGVDLYANFAGENVVAVHPGSGNTGALTTGALPQNTAYLFQKRTALGGRANRGRGYVPGVGEDVVDNAGVVTPARRALIQDDLDTWHAAIVGLTGVVGPVVLHVANIPEPTPITSFTIDLRVATQRRRLR